jgi:hypothetical protein
MDKPETEKLLIYIQKAYPNHFKDFDPETFEFQATLWHRALAEFSAKEGLAIFEYWANTEKFPPTLAEFKELAARSKNPIAFLSAEKAWETVDKAVRKFGWNNQDKAFNSLKPNVIRAVQSIGGWQKVCQTPLGQEWDFLKKNFKSAYDEWQEETQDQALLPPSVLSRLQEMAVHKALEHKE